MSACSVIFGGPLFTFRNYFPNTNSREVGINDKIVGTGKYNEEVSIVNYHYFSWLGTPVHSACMAYGDLSLIHQDLPAMCLVDPAGRLRLDGRWWLAVIVKKSTEFVPYRKNL